MKKNFKVQNSLYLIQMIAFNYSMYLELKILTMKSINICILETNQTEPTNLMVNFYFYSYVNFLKKYYFS